MSDNLKGQVVSSLRWQAAAKVISQLVSWPITIVVMRLLAPADYGLMAMTMVLVGFTALVAEMGLGAALVRAPQVDERLQRRVFGLALSVNGLLYGALLLLSPLAVMLFNEPRLGPLYAAMGLSLPLAALATVPDAMARRELRFKTLSKIELAQHVANALLTLASAALGYGVWSLVIGQIGSGLLRVILLHVSVGGVRPQFQLRGEGELLRFGSSLTLNRVLWYFSGQADVFVAGRMLGEQLLGYYAVAVNLATMPMQKLMQVANQVAYSAFAKLQHEPERRNAALLATTTQLSAIAVALLWGLAATAPDLIPLLLGEKWLPAVLPLQIVAAVVPVRIVATLMSTTLLASGHVHDDLKNTIAGALILLPAFVIGVHLDGLRGLALAWAIGYPLYGLLPMRRACQRFGLRPLQLLAQVRVPLLAGAAMVAVIVALQQALASQPLALRLAATVAAGGLGYLAVLRLAAPSLLGELRSFLRR